MLEACFLDASLCKPHAGVLGKVAYGTVKAELWEGTESGGWECRFMLLRLVELEVRGPQEVNTRRTAQLSSASCYVVLFMCCCDSVWLSETLAWKVSW